MGLAAFDAPPDLLGRQRPAGARIERRAVGIARPGPAAPGLPAGNGLADVPAGAEARIEEAPLLQRQGGAAVVAEVLRLPPDGLLPAQAEPGEIVVDGRLEGGTAAGDVDILDAQEKPAAESPGEVVVEQGRIGVPEMKPPVGAASKAE